MGATVIPTSSSARFRQVWTSSDNTSEVRIRKIAETVQISELLALAWAKISGRVWASLPPTLINFRDFSEHEQVSQVCDYPDLAQNPKNWKHIQRLSLCLFGKAALIRK